MSAASVLGESWVVASAHSANEDQFKKQTSKSQEVADSNHGSDSVTTSTSSMSGPELIMPSIYEGPLSEASWVAPTVRVKRTSPKLRRRHQTSSAKKPLPDVTNRDNHLTTTVTTSQNQRQFQSRLLETSVRTLINVVLLAAISHLLILPELVQQYQTLFCTFGPITALYPSSCIPFYAQPLSHSQRPPSTRFETVISFQAHLESLFNATLHELTPLFTSLKETESHLQEVERELKRTHPGTKHELDLEFVGCRNAISRAAQKFDSLTFDLQSAVSSLVAAGNVKRANPATTTATTDSHSSSVAHDARLFTQMSRRKDYLNQLAASMRSKADSLAADLATLDDHLESIESIVDRETRRSRSSAQSKRASQDSSYAASRLLNLVDSIVPPSVKLPSFLLRSEQEEQGEKNEEEEEIVTSDSTLSQIHKAASFHRPLAETARQLSNRLQ